METIELFCGTKSFSKVAAQRGFRTFTVDNEPEFEAHLTKSVLDLSASELPKRPLILWASPPCQAFSVAAIGKNWNKEDRTPKHPRAAEAQELVKKTISLIEEVGPTWWFIENPRGMLRKMPFMQGFIRHTVSYCQYGDTRQKPTDIWTNAWWWTPRPICERGAPCHEAAPRGARTGTQGITGDRDRSRIPPALFDEIFNQLQQQQREAA